MAKMTMSRQEREDGLELFDSIWQQCRGHSPDVACFALLSVLATVISGAAENPQQTAERMAKNLVSTVGKPAEKSGLN